MSNVVGCTQAPDALKLDALAAELIARCTGTPERHAVPKSLDFIDRMLRTPTGKLFKKLLKDTQWAGRTPVC
jgi:long-chain acyl-CoA synthetase